MRHGNFRGDVFAKEIFFCGFDVSATYSPLKFFFFGWPRIRHEIFFAVPTYSPRIRHGNFFFLGHVFFTESFFFSWRIINSMGLIARVNDKRRLHAIFQLIGNSR